MKETIATINKTKSWFSEKINKIDKQLTRLIKKKKKKEEDSNQQNLKWKRTYSRQHRNTKAQKKLL